MSRKDNLKQKLGIEPEMVRIPAGEFLMGSDPDKDRDAQDKEQPQHRLHLPDYHIAKTPVTNAQYLAFVQDIGHRKPDYWGKGKLPKNEEDHPVVYVSWHDAMAYCQWLAEKTDKPYRLPSEAEWEKAARGIDGRIFPWGDEPPDENRCSFGKGVVATTRVGMYSPQGDSPYGCVDMAGNVWEWTLSLWGRDFLEPDFKYPYDPDDGRENLQSGGDICRVLRGGAFSSDEDIVRCACRLWDDPYDSDSYFGFRVVLAPGL